MSLEIPRSPNGENPRKASPYYVKIKGDEHDVLIEAYSRLGGDVDTLTPISEPALSHNNGVTQLIRALVQGRVSADDFEEPIPRPESEENRFAKCNVALLPSEVKELRETVALGEGAERWRNRRDDYRKIRQGVILPFVEAVTEGRE